MSHTAVFASSRGLIFTQSLLFLIAASSDESSKYEDVREKLLVDYSVLFSPQFGAKEKEKKTCRQFEPLGKNIYSRIPFMLCYLVITILRIKDELISVCGWLAVLKGEMSGHWKATKFTCVIIIFIALVGKMTELSESSISFRAQRGFKLNILDRNSYIMSHVYIKHGFT